MRPSFKHLLRSGSGTIFPKYTPMQLIGTNKKLETPRYPDFCSLNNEVLFSTLGSRNDKVQQRTIPIVRSECHCNGRTVAISEGHGGLNEIFVVFLAKIMTQYFLEDIGRTFPGMNVGSSSFSGVDSSLIPMSKESKFGA